MPSKIDLAKWGNFDRIVVAPSWGERTKVQFAPGARRRAGGKDWSFPANPRIVEYLFALLDAPEFTIEASTWYAGRQAKERILIAAKRWEDAVVRHKKAELLWPFQRAAVNFLLHARRALLADQCGLGKTATAIVTVEASGRDDRVLVVCPNSLKRWWADEIMRWSQRETPMVFLVPNGRGPRERALAEYSGGWLIVHWEALRLLPQLAQRGWSYLVLDEAHRIKNRRTQMFQALSKVPSARVIELTGTPFSNDVSELWTLLQILQPRTYTSFWQFYEMYVRYAETPFGRKVTGSKNDDLLRAELAPVMIRRTKEAVLPELPPKRYRRVRLGLHPKQMRAYKQMAREALVVLGDKEIMAPNVVAQIVRLKQLTCSLGILGEQDVSTKLDALMGIVGDAPEEKFVVFTCFARMLDLVEERLQEHGVKFASIRGGLGTEKVLALVERFQETSPEECQVFCGTIQTGGVGLTLTAASQLIFTDKHWNPAVQEQAEDRIHRIGQARGVVITTLHCVGTVDETIERVLARKEKVSHRILAQETADDLRRYLKEVL